MGEFTIRQTYIQLSGWDSGNYVVGCGGLGSVDPMKTLHLSSGQTEEVIPLNIRTGEIIPSNI